MTTTTTQSDLTRAEIDAMIADILQRLHADTLLSVTPEERQQLTHAHACMTDVLRNVHARSAP